MVYGGAADGSKFTHLFTIPTTAMAAMIFGHLLDFLLYATAHSVIVFSTIYDSLWIHQDSAHRITSSKSARSLVANLARRSYEKHGSY